MEKETLEEFIMSSQVEKIMTRGGRRRDGSTTSKKPK